MPKAIDLTGRKFGRLEVLRFAYTDGVKRRWQCSCDCGKEVVVKAGNLQNGSTKSCGCYNSEMIRRSDTKHRIHGISRTPTGRSWQMMIHRCYDTAFTCYKHYGGRGIRICEFLRASPLNLCVLIGSRPDKHSLDRINNNGNYSCGSCSDCILNGWLMNIKWSTQKEQCRNKRTNLIVVIGGVSRCVAEWAELYKLSSSLIYRRIYRGMSGANLLLQP